MNPAQVESAINSAARLMNEGYMRHLDGIASGKSKGGSKGSNDLAYIEQQVFGYDDAPTTPSYQMPTPQQNTGGQFSNEALNEAFRQVPSLGGMNFPGASQMVSNMANLNIGMPGYQPSQALLNEQYLRQQQQAQYLQQAQQASGIDYNVIKYLVSEAIKENMAEIRQSMLNENSLRGINMPGGNKIQFLDSKGNLYEGQLVLKKKKQ